jgi:hypothetical protein
MEIVGLKRENNEKIGKIIGQNYPCNRLWSRDSSVGIATGYGLDDQRGGSPGRVKKIFHFSISSRQVLGSTQPPIKWVPGTLSRG